MLFPKVWIRSHRIPDASRALAARAMLRLGEGDLQAAREDLMALHRLARLIGQPPLMVPRLFADSIESRAFSAEIAIAHRGQLTVALVLEMRQAAEKLSPMPSMAEAFDIGERYSQLDVIQTLANDGLDSISSIYPQKNPFRTWIFLRGPLIDFDAALRTTNRIVDHITTGMREADPKKRDQVIDN